MRSEPTSHKVEQLQLEGIRRQAGLPTTPREAPWTACRGPSTTLVIDRDGSVRACRGATGATAGPTDLACAWTSPQLVDLRRRLADGELPLPHCHECARWLQHGLAELAPMLRDHGEDELPTAAAGPSRLVVRLPLAPAVATALPAALPELLRDLAELVLEVDAAAALDAPFATDLLARAAEVSARRRIDLRGAPTPAMADSLAGHVDELECTFDAADAEQLGEARAVATRIGADMRARFVFTAGNWFEFEDLALRCADAGIPLDLRVLDRDGAVPVAGLPTEELQFLRDVVASTWRRCGQGARPASLAEHAFEHVCHELRHSLRERVEAEVDGSSFEMTGMLQLPAPGHPWNTDPERRAWWWQMLFGRGHLAAVERWLVQLAEHSPEQFEPDEHAWLRALAQRVANERHPEALLALLRDLYGPPKRRKALIAADQQFAGEFDLTRFGGPWARQLGLLHDRGRRRPFAVGKPVPSTGPADVTVLIPSYRHEAFIAETIRSVLAQDYGNHRVLVVDDRSPDATVERARAIDDERLEVRVNERNLGLGNSVLQALASIETPYVALLNSDDLFHPDRLGRCRAVLESSPDVQLVTTGIHLVDHRGGRLTPTNASLVLDGKQVFDWVHWFDRVTPPEDLPAGELFAALLERNFLVTSSNLVARTDWLRAQADGLRSLKYCLDWQLFLQAALEGALHHIHEPLIAYRLHASNTVWFREGRRWSYFLEVNRVAAEAVQRFLAQDRLSATAKLRQVVDSVTRHLATNTEMDGLALFLNAVLDALQLDRATETDDDVRRQIEALNDRAERLRELRQRYGADDREGADAAAHHLLGQLAGEQLQIERNRRRWLQGYTEDLERRLEEATLARERLENEKAQLYADQRERIERAKKLEEEKARLYADQRERIERANKLEEEKAKLYADQRERIEYAKKLEAEKVRLYADQRERIERAKKLEAEKAKLYADQRERVERAKQLEQQIQRLERQLGERDGQLADSRTKAEELQQRLAAARQEHRTQVAALEQAKGRLERQRSELQHEVASLRDKIDRLLKTREFRTGNFIWNKLPLGYMSRRGKKWYRRLLDAKDRASMLFKRKQKSAGTAVVAACWQWPIYSHTFVYQEMISMTRMGLDVRLFHWDLGDTDQLHAAFRYLYDNRTQLQPIWENHQKDLEHFEKTRPGKLRSFLERIAPLSGKTVDELYKEPIVLQGCTFARMAELADARYLHSYFFYDQSFMAMQAAWLLDLPRGVSCYADHMMDDYPWKFVALHVELCDVIVATSARIKRELSELSGGQFDDKIIVKPNGVDGERFPARRRPDRKPSDPFEVLSVSRIEPKKGLTYLVEAIASLKAKGHTVIAHIIGSKDEHSKGSLEYAAEFEACIKEHGLEDQVILHGMMKQEQMPPIIEKCRAFVAPYVETESGDKDGIPTAMLEALASSLPVITTDSGSITEVVDDGVEGLIVPQRDSAAYAAALEKVILDPALEQRLATAARARFDKDFDIRVTERRLHERVAGFLAAKV